MEPQAARLWRLGAAEWRGVSCLCALQFVVGAKKRRCRMEGCWKALRKCAREKREDEKKDTSSRQDREPLPGVGSKKKGFDDERRPSPSPRSIAAAYTYKASGALPVRWREKRTKTNCLGASGRREKFNRFWLLARVRNAQKCEAKRSYRATIRKETPSCKVLTHPPR